MTAVIAAIVRNRRRRSSGSSSCCRSRGSRLVAVAVAAAAKVVVVAAAAAAAAVKRTTVDSVLSTIMLPSTPRCSGIGRHTNVRAGSADLVPVEGHGASRFSGISKTLDRFRLYPAICKTWNIGFQIIRGSVCRSP